jgi:hypothetical protein
MKPSCPTGSSPRQRVGGIGHGSAPGPQRQRHPDPAPRPPARAERQDDRAGRGAGRRPGRGAGGAVEPPAAPRRPAHRPALCPLPRLRGGRHRHGGRHPAGRRCRRPGSGRRRAAGRPRGSARHLGAHDRLADAYTGLQAWPTDHGHQPAGPGWEVYHWIDLDQEPDPARWPNPSSWRTQLVQPISEEPHPWGRPWPHPPPPARS